MHKKLEDFTTRELIERRAIQELLHAVLKELKVSLDKQRYNDAIFYNINGTRLLNLMVERSLALEDEKDMLTTLRLNVNNILRLQHRLQ
jgi:hypothetical protein